METDISKIENYIDFLTNCLRDDYASNVRKTENVESTYKDKKKQLTLDHYLRYGDIHYFVSRFLFLSGICKYSYFAAQQCIELYLKAFIKYKNYSPPDSHVLPELANKCRQLAKNEDFIKSTRIMTIAEKFNPFYEFVRYPIQKRSPQNGTYAFLYPDEIQILDYFVYQMRKIIPYPKNSYDILKERRLPGMITTRGATADTLFKCGNINIV